MEPTGEITLVHIQAALESLYNDPNPQNKDAAQKWLIKAQRDKSAWNWCFQDMFTENPMSRNRRSFSDRIYRRKWLLEISRSRLRFHAANKFSPLKPQAASRSQIRIPNRLNLYLSRFYEHMTAFKQCIFRRSTVFWRKCASLQNCQLLEWNSTGTNCWSSPDSHGNRSFSPEKYTF